jgi:hypothetical protein
MENKIYDSRKPEYRKEYNKKYYERNKIKRREYYNKTRVFCESCHNYYYGGSYMKKHKNSEIHKKKHIQEYLI